jgi:cystathionine beta-lyase family protein involved in aluminum resistance
MMDTTTTLLQLMGFDKDIIELDSLVVRDIREQFDSIDQVRLYNQAKVLKAMQDERLSDTHFAGTTGYGYGDAGRDIIDRIFAKVFGAEDALVRVQMISGTHALSTCLRGILRPGDRMLSITGKPYETLEEVIGIRGNALGNLKEYGIEYDQVDLDGDGRIDLTAVREKLTSKVRLVFMQRSTGYDWRPAVSIGDIKTTIDAVKEMMPDVVVMVDNCYGEFLERLEPTQVGADIMAGSLIKNPGGGLAPTGGYIVGKEKLIKLAASSLYAPGLGKKGGATMGVNRHFLQGLFLAPHVVSEAIKGAVYASRAFEVLGFKVSPRYNDKRSDIIQSIEFNTEDQLLSFCWGIQKGAPVDSHVTPYPWDMPGYGHKVIMAAGAFIQGSSIELSADAPVRKPYYGYLQGGLTWDHTRLGVMTALQQMKSQGHIDLGRR